MNTNRGCIWLISRVIIRHAIASQQINRAHVKARTFCRKEEDRKKRGTR